MRTSPAWGRLYHDNVIDHYEVRGRARAPATQREPASRAALPVSGCLKALPLSQNPRNVGSLDPKSEEVGSGLVGAPACGDVMKFQVRVKDGVVRSVCTRVGTV
jgi:hypothetical protein